MKRGFFILILLIFCIKLNGADYTIKRVYNGTEYDYVISTDENGDIIMNLDSNPFSKLEGDFYIPESVEIDCRNFYIYGDGEPNNCQDFSLTNYGTINCSGSFGIGRDNSTLGAYFKNSKLYKQYFVNDKLGTIIADNIKISYNYAIPELQGAWKSTNTISITNGQGQDMTFGEYCSIDCTTLDINCNISNSIVIEGDVRADYIKSSKKLFIDTDGEITVGIVNKSNWQLGVVVGYGGTLHLCKNPSSDSDDLGFAAGTILYNASDWTDTDPELEQDINKYMGNSYWDYVYKFPTIRRSETYDFGSWSYTVWKTYIKAEKVFGAYSSYENCMEHKVDGNILGIDDEINDGKEISIPINSCNICSDEFDYLKIKISSVTYRYVNGELIYCENDN